MNGRDKIVTRLLCLALIASALAALIASALAADYKVIPYEIVLAAAAFTYKLVSLQR